MNDFLIQCLEDLESLTGIRQYYFLTTDPDGGRKTTVLIRGILEVCKQFPYISEADQKKIISEQMVKDQNYDSLNSRTVWKWLNGAKDVYWAKTQEKVQEVKPLEHLSEETQKLIRDWQASLLGLNATQGDISKEMDNIRAEDESRLQGKEIRKGSNLSKFQTTKEVAEIKELHRLWIKDNYHTVTGKPLETWKPEAEWIEEKLASGEIRL